MTKKIIKLFLFSLFLLLPFTLVKALDIKEGMNVTTFVKETFTVSDLKIQKANGTKIDPRAIHYGVNVLGNKLTGYCIDPNSAGLETLYISRLIGAKKPQAYSAIFDFGLLKMYEMGYNEDNPSITINTSSGNITLTGNHFYFATTVAIRAYTIGFWNYGRDSAYDLAYPSAHAYEAIKWVKKDELKDALKILKTHDKTKVVQGESWYQAGSKFVTNTTVGKNILLVAEKLFDEGIKAAANFKNGSITPASFTESVQDSKITKVGNTKTLIRTITLKAQNFGATGMINGLNITFEKNRDVTVSNISYKIDGKSVLNLNSPGLKTNPTLTISFTVSTTSDDCDPLKYTLNYSYTDPSLNRIGAVLDSKNSVSIATKNGTVTNQRFIFMVPKGLGGGTNAVLNGSVPICGNACDTKITIPKACTEIGKDSENDYLDASITGPENVLRCVVGENETVNKYDDAGNKYMAGSCGVGNIASNPYCSVYCKEDYPLIRFSGIQTVNSGRYFKIGAQIEGRKTCYTSKINIEKYVKDIIDAQKKMITAYNNYNKWVAYSNNIDSNSSQYRGGRTITCPVPKEGETPRTPPCCERAGYCTGYYAMASNVAQYTYSSFNANGEIIGLNSRNTSFGTYSSDGGSSSSCSSCTSGSRSKLLANINSNIKTYKDAIESARSQYTSIINQLNSCSSSTGWRTTFDFSQTIDYDYDEDYMDLKTVSDSDRRLEIVKGPTISKTDEWKCAGELSPNDKGKYELCENSNIPENANKTYTTCTTSGCYTETKSVSQVRYVKRSVEKRATYDTKRIFHTVFPSGNIIHKNDASKTSLQTEAVDGLPVMLKTGVGSHNFTYEINNLGEFYDTCKAGRIVGATNSVANATANSDANDYKFTGEYVCHYVVNCPECKLVCNPGGCDITVPSACKTNDGCCVECIFTINSLQLYYRSITLNKFNPNDRALGYNWNYTYNINHKFGFVSKKADKTLNDSTTGINAQKEDVYNNKPILSVKLTPELSTNIREKNRKYEPDGGYANQSLKCYSFKHGGAEYKNVYCYSTFLDEFIKDDRFTFIETRLGEEASRKNSNDQGGYFKTFITGMPQKNADPSSIGGPSWK